MHKLKRRPFVLLIRDGWGQNPDPSQNKYNAIHCARTPVDEWLTGEYPNMLIRTSGEAVGLPDGVMGNSEVGHQNIGAGRLIDQEMVRISKSIRDESLFSNEVLVGAYAHARETGGAVHLMGLCSDAGVHSILEHLYGVLEASNRVGFDPGRVFLHMFSDGRDSPPYSGIDYLREIEAKMGDLGVGRVASVCGRYYAMDRNNCWDRVELAYRMLTEGEGHRADSAAVAFQRYYDNPTSAEQSGDEFIEPTLVCPEGSTPRTVTDGDSIIFLNFRGDRPRELTKAFTFEDFPFVEHGEDSPLGFRRQKRPDVYYATMTAYEEGLPVRVIFPRRGRVVDGLGEYVSRLGLRQLRCAETEKFAHVTFFFNDCDEQFEGEQRVLIPSPRDVATYDQKPEMAAREVTAAVLEELAADRHDVIIMNYANCDMVGHSGDLAATVAAVEAVDDAVGTVARAVLGAGGQLIVTADHGNCEQMIDPSTGGAQRAHTTFDVPLIVVDDTLRGERLRGDGILADVAPTALRMMQLEQPSAMSGKSLLLSDAPRVQRGRRNLTVAE
ncbi:MAG: 2,3-bisphosphoglycerate-independent phosphoglycerate mutase [bacterium]|nr:2,3-bisphosphoglycerate-independent phosphoglycerate mutase [bacterium]